VPQDIAWNRALERLHGHGSCGVGYGTAVERGRAGILLSAKDLDCGWIFAQKLKGIGLYYEELISRRNTGLLAELYCKEIDGQTDEAFMDACVQARPLYGLAGLRSLGSKYDQLILEGSQGILLDAEEGAYPHLSWGSVTSQAAMAFLLELLPADLDGNSALEIILANNPNAVLRILENAAAALPNASSARSRSSRLWAADTCTRMRAMSFGTTG